MITTSTMMSSSSMATVLASKHLATVVLPRSAVLTAARPTSYLTRILLSNTLFPSSIITSSTSSFLFSTTSTSQLFVRHRHFLTPNVSYKYKKCNFANVILHPRTTMMTTTTGMALPPMISMGTITGIHAVPVALHDDVVVSTRRNFSSDMMTTTMMPRRAFPQYTSFGTEYAMGVKASMPQFKRSGVDGISVDRRGKLTLEFIPRNNTGVGFAWNEKIFFSLTVEEVGLLLSRLPMNSVELSHPVFGPEGNNIGGEGDDLMSMEGRGSGGGGGFRQLAGDVIEKVLTIVPEEGGAVSFTIDFVKDGVPGQTPPGVDGMPNTPMRVVIQAGEFEVFKSIFQTSIPYLLGWNTTMDIASAAAISRGLMGGGGYNNSMQ